MASREASLKVTLQPAAFQSKLRGMVNMTKSAGKQMGQGLKGPITAGLKSAKASLGSMLGGIKRGIGMAATLGGALSFTGLARDAVNMQNTYRNIAFNVNKVADNAETWESVQKMINTTVQETGRSAKDLSDSFMEVFEATGNLEFSVKAMKTIGTTATATGHSMGALATTMQLASRKFGIGPEQAEEAMARFIEKTGVGGKGIEQMTSRFALMAGEAANAGMKGTEGISEMLGMLLLLDSSIGEKADPGLKMMFQTLKGGSAQFLRLKKVMRGFKFTADMTAMDKIKTLLRSGKGRAMAEQVFTADARVVYDELAKPFDEAMNRALAQGMTKKEAMKVAMAAFDKNLNDAAKSTMDYAKIQKEAAARQKDDPLVKMNKALARIGDAFTKPKMIEAMNKLADKLPAFADAVADIIGYILDNPWESLAMVVGGKLALAFGGSMIQSVMAKGVTTLFARGAAIQAASAAGTVATRGAASLGLGGAIAGGAGGATGLAGAGAAAAGAATVAAGVLAAGAVGAGVGTLAYKYGGVEKAQAGEFGAQEQAMYAREKVSTAIRTGDSAKMNEALQGLLQAQAALKNSESTWNTIFGTVAATISDVESPSEMRAAEDKRMAEAQAKLIKAMNALKTGTDNASNAVRKLGVAADATRGPMPPAEPSPGASAKGG